MKLLRLRCLQREIHMCLNGPVLDEYRIDPTAADIGGTPGGRAAVIGGIGQNDGHVIGADPEPREPLEHPVWPEPDGKRSLRNRRMQARLATQRGPRAVTFDGHAARQDQLRISSIR